MLRLIIGTALALGCMSVLPAEVIVKDGKDFLLLPADLVAKNSRNSIYWAQPYEIGNEDGHLHVSKVYQEVFEFDATSMKAIDAALLKLEHDYLKFLHQHAEISKSTVGTMVFKIKDVNDEMTTACTEFTTHIEGLLSPQQKLTAKYFNIMQVNNAGSSNYPIIEGGSATITLSGSEGHYEIIHKIDRSGGQSSGSSSGTEKSGAFLLYERAYRYHLYGTFE